VTPRFSTMLVPPDVAAARGLILTIGGPAGGELEHDRRWGAGASDRRACLDWILILGQRHIEAVLREFVEHYNAARPHRALDLCPPLARWQPVDATGEVVLRDRLGRLIHEHARRAAPAAYRA
jgi:hypothetical protein